MHLLFIRFIPSEAIQSCKKWTAHVQIIGPHGLYSKICTVWECRNMRHDCISHCMDYREQFRISRYFIGLNQRNTDRTTCIQIRKSPCSWCQSRIAKLFLVPIFIIEIIRHRLNAVQIIVKLISVSSQLCRIHQSMKSHLHSIKPLSKENAIPVRTNISLSLRHTPKSMLIIA